MIATKVKNQVPKTVIFAGRRFKIKLAPGQDTIWLVQVSKIGGFEFICVEKIQNHYFAQYLEVHGNAPTIQEAIEKVEKRLLAHFKTLGKILGYDVED